MSRWTTLIRSALILFVAVAITPSVSAQDDPDAKPASEETKSPSVEVPADHSTTGEDSVTIDGQVVPYRVTTGTQPVWDGDGEAIASMFYTYYERSDVEDRKARPLVFSFNGGPGSASVWMHLAYTGPRLLKIDDEGYPVQPYGIQENPHSILDVADTLLRWSGEDRPRSRPEA
jgi:carboxypeptidase C (cathepsin A)